MLETTDRPGIEERYVTANLSSNLLLETREGAPSGSIDVIVAAGWSASRIGAALMRLHTEFDSAAKPRAMTPEAIRRLAGSLTVDQLDTLGKDLRLSFGAMKLSAVAEYVAKHQADAWYAHEVKMQLGRLKSLGAVREQVTLQANGWGIDGDVASAVIAWWLSKVCPKCHGRKFELAKDTPALSTKHCRACRGSGEAPIPHGEPGKRLARWLDECVERAQASIKKRLHTMQ